MGANVGFWGGLSCLLGRHVRSRGQARATPEGWVSRCARCAIPMARAHGGGKWQAVKMPKIGKDGSVSESSAERMAKAMARSRKTGERKDDKATAAARKLAHAESAPDADAGGAEGEAPVRRKRRLFRRSKSASAQTASTSQAKRGVFRRARKADEDAPRSLAQDVADEPAAKPRRALFRRKTRTAAAEAAPSDLASFAEDAMARPSRRRRRKSGDTPAE